MLDKDIYVLHSSSECKSKEDIIEHFSKMTRLDAENIESVIIALAAYCVYISMEELYMLYPQNSVNFSGRIIPKLIKEGYLLKKDISRASSISTVVYAITKKGFERANGIGRLDVKYKSGRKDAGIPHTFATGNNLFQLLLMDVPFAYEREVLYTSSSSFDRLGALQIDAISHMYFDDMHIKRILYIEEDLGHEKYNTLLSKLDNYYQYGLMDSRKNMIVFSFKRDDIRKKANSKHSSTCFSHKKCSDLMKYMKSIGADSIFSILDDYPDRDFVEKFLVTVGAFKVDKKSKEMIKVHDVSLNFLKEFTDSLLFLNCPYEHREFNKSHASLSYGRLYEMATDIILNQYDHMYVNRMLRGMQVLCVPTQLLSDRIKFALLDHYEDLRFLLMESLSCYFEGIRYVSEYAEKLTLNNRIDVVLKNRFTYIASNGNTAEIFVEFAGMDLSAFLRAYYFTRLYKGSDIKSLVIVFETLSQAAAFFELTKYIYPDFLSNKDASRIYGLLLSDIGEPYKLFIVNDPSDYYDTFFLPN